MRIAGLKVAAVLLALSPCVPAHAEVMAKNSAGFVTRNVAEVKATPAEAWAVLVKPAGWWLSAHTFSGDAANMTLDPVAGGCFCERLPVPEGAPKGRAPGGVQHARAIYVDPGKAIRLSGALGPLQSEALQGTLTITIKPVEGGTRILWEYVVGGFMRYNVDDIAPAVDKVLAAQVASLAKQLGPIATAAPLTVLTEPAAPPVTKMPAVKSVTDDGRSVAGGATPGTTWRLPPAGSAKVAKPAVTAPPANSPPVKPVAKLPLAVPAKAKAPVAPTAKAPSTEDKDKNAGIAAFDQALGTAAH